MPILNIPFTKAGLEAADRSVKAGMRVNMTLCFSVEQAAAVYATTLGAKKGMVFMSPFVGRLDDQGQKGMDLIENILEIYQKGDDHVQVLTASVRNLNHFLQARNLRSDIITAPLKVLQQWVSLDLNKNWRDFDIKHELTDVGIERFAADWNNLIKS